MSSSLYWRPPHPQGDYLGYALKFKLRDYWNEGFIGEWTAVDKSLVPFLRGLAAAGNQELKEQAETLIALIDKYGEVEIRESS